MRAVLLGVVLVLLAGCSAAVRQPAPIPAYQNRTYQPQPRPYIKGKDKRNNAKPEAVGPTEESRPWDITEDRFLSTHPPDMSSEVLKRTPDEIKNRQKELSKPSS